MPRHIEYIIPQNFDGSIVKNFLRKEMKLSAKLMRSLKHYDDGIMLNGEHIRVVDTIRAGDLLEINIPDFHGDIEPIEMPLDIVYEDDDFIAVNKSPFLAVHPTHNHQGDTLANALIHYLKTKNKPTVFRAVGRLDKGTSGIVICALNSHAASRLPETVKKEYLAVVSGETEHTGRIEAPIYRPDPMKTIRCVDERGDYALTYFEKISGNSDFSLVRVRIATGRTHQIRVHFSSIGMPLAGDSLYGEDKFGLGHQLLHCAKVEFDHPVTGRHLILEAPMPDDMQKFISEHI